MLITTISHQCCTYLEQTQLVMQARNTNLQKFSQRLDKLPRVCYRRNWYDSNEHPPPRRIHPADRDCTFAPTVLTHQTTASCQPLPFGSSTLGMVPPTALLSKPNSPAPAGKVSVSEFAATGYRRHHNACKTAPTRLKSCPQHTHAELGCLWYLRCLENSRAGQLGKNQPMTKQCSAAPIQRGELRN